MIISSYDFIIDRLFSNFLLNIVSSKMCVSIDRLFFVCVFMTVSITLFLIPLSLKESLLCDNFYMALPNSH